MSKAGEVYANLYKLSIKRGDIRVIPEPSLDEKKKALAGLKENLVKLQALQIRLRIMLKEIEELTHE